MIHRAIRIDFPFNANRIIFFIFFLLLTFYNTGNEAKEDLAINLPANTTSINEKQILFITHKFKIGGSQRSLLNLLNNWNLPNIKNVHIDLCILDRGGQMEQFLPHDIPIVSLTEACQKQYDVAIANVHITCCFQALREINASKKIQWIRNDLSKTNSPYKQRKNTEGVDAFVCVSQTVAQGFQTIHPTLTDQVHVIYNVIDASFIKEQAKEIPLGMKTNDGILNVVTVCRLTFYQKALDRAIRVHEKLNELGFHLRWYIVGEGSARKMLEKLIQEKQLQENFILLGEKTNPYPYIKAADIIAHLSRYEGRSNVILEAKVLEKPIIMTDVLGASESITNNVNGLIVSQNEKAICEGLKQLLVNPDLRAQFSSALQGFENDNESIYQQIEEVFFDNP